MPRSVNVCPRNRVRYTRTDPDETAIGRPTATARRLVAASVSANTRRAYARRPRPVTGRKAQFFRTAWLALTRNPRSDRPISLLVLRYPGILPSTCWDVEGPTDAGCASPWRRTEQHGTNRSPVPTVDRQQLADGVVVGNVGWPSVGGRDGSIESRVRIDEPLWAGVVKVGQRTLLERLGGVLVAGDRPLWIARNRATDCPGFPNRTAIGVPVVA